MKLSKGSRPSPALVLAALALVFAMVGTAIAGPDAISGKITKSKVKKISTKQANKAIDAAEPDLNVNSAKTADSATNATNATTVNDVGAAQITYKQDSVSGNQTIFTGAGLTIQAACATGDDISLTATTSKANSSIYTSSVITDADNNNNNLDLESGDFDVGDTFDLLGGGTGNPNLITFEYDSNDGSSVSGVLVADEDNEIGDDCQVHGHVLFG